MQFCLHFLGAGGFEFLYNWSSVLSDLKVDLGKIDTCLFLLWEWLVKDMHM